MPISRVSRRVIVLSLVILLTVILLALALGFFTAMHTQAAPGSGKPIPAGYSIGQVDHFSITRQPASHPVVVKPASDDCMSVPSWDITQIHLQTRGSNLIQLYFKLDGKYVS